MYWDRTGAGGDTMTGIEIHGSGLQDIPVPPNACGFRLEQPDKKWDEAWYFTEYGTNTVLEVQSILYESSFFDEFPDFIEARGPVYGCSSGEYFFHTPLSALGITDDDPVYAGAGAFIAEFSRDEAITWLDSAGKPIKDPKPPKPQKPTKLPPEFFEQPPEVKGCFRDFEGELHCPEENDTDSAPRRNTNALGNNVPQHLAMLIGQHSSTIPHFKAIAVPTTTKATSVTDNKVEVTCPAELVLTATFYKRTTQEPAMVTYRFRFIHGPISTVFTTMVDKDGENTVFHSVPIPLPPPIDQKPGGTTKPSGPENIAVVKKRDPNLFEPSIKIDPHFTIETLPSNEHRSSVRVEVLNVSDGIFSSDWTEYHVVCSEESTRPKLRLGMRGSGVPALQVGLNKWLRNQRMPLLRVDGMFGPRTQEVVKAFQDAMSIDDGGVVGTKTWKHLQAIRTRK
jgi:hypothetical protein